MRVWSVLLLTICLTAGSGHGGPPRPCECQGATCADARCQAGGDCCCKAGPAPQPMAPSAPKADEAVRLTHRQFGQFVFLQAETEGKKVRFAPLTDGLERVPPEFIPQTDKSAVFHAKHGGEYRVLAYTAKGDEPSEPVIVTIKVDGPEPSPPPVPPGPDPGPTPNPPTPGSKTFWLVVVEDEDGPTADQARLLGDEAFWSQLKARGHSFRQYRPESPAAIERNYVTQAKKVGLPALLLIEREGGRPPAAAVPLPADTAGVDALVRKAGGK